MKSKERYTVKTAKEKILIHTDDLEEALKIKEEHKQEGAYIDDRKSKNKHRTTQKEYCHISEAMSGNKGIKIIK